MRILDGAFLDALETLDINVQQMKSGHYSGARRSRPRQARLPAVPAAVDPASWRSISFSARAKNIEKTRIPASSSLENV